MRVEVKIPKGPLSLDAPIRRLESRAIHHERMAEMAGEYVKVADDGQERTLSKMEEERHRQQAVEYRFAADVLRQVRKGSK